MIKIDWVKKSVFEKSFVLSNHADNERANDNLLLSELTEAISNGMIIEHYE